MAHFHLMLHQLLVDQPIGRGLSHRGIEAGRIAVFKGGKADALVDLAIGNHLLAGRYGDAVHNDGAQRGQRQQG